MVRLLYRVLLASRLISPRGRWPGQSQIRVCGGAAATGHKQQYHDGAPPRPCERY